MPTNSTNSPHFHDGAAIFAGVGGAVVHAGAEVAEDGLASTDVIGGVRGDALDFVAAAFEVGDDFGGDAGFEFRVATLKGELGHARSFKRGLNVEFVVDDFGDKLGVGLGLV